MCLCWDLGSYEMARSGYTSFIVYLISSLSCYESPSVVFLKGQTRFFDPLSRSVCESCSWTWIFGPAVKVPSGEASPEAMLSLHWFLISSVSAPVAGVVLSSIIILWCFVTDGNESTCPLLWSVFNGIAAVKGSS